MKKAVKFGFTMLMMVFTSMAFVSCGDDNPIDDDENPAASVAGTYVGNGGLSYLGISLESYSGMQFQLTRSSNEYVLVTPKMATGENFFGGSGSSAFQVTKTAKGGYSLMCNESPGTILTISRDGHLSYTNPNVSVNDEGGYTLSFEGDKE